MNESATKKGKVIDVLIDGDIVAVARENHRYYEPTGLNIDDFVNEYEITFHECEGIEILELDYMPELIKWANKWA